MRNPHGDKLVIHPLDLQAPWWQFGLETYRGYFKPS